MPRFATGHFIYLSAWQTNSLAECSVIAMMALNGDYISDALETKVDGIAPGATLPGKLAML